MSHSESNACSIPVEVASINNFSLVDGPECVSTKEQEVTKEDKSNFHLEGLAEIVAGEYTKQALSATVNETEISTNEYDSADDDGLNLDPSTVATILETDMVKKLPVASEEECEIETLAPVKEEKEEKNQSLMVQAIQIEESYCPGTLTSNSI